MVVVRKRTIYAHSDILKRRSDYFKDIIDFNNDSRGSDPGSADAGQIQTIYCEDADFQTLWWMLRWIYTTDLVLDLDTDVRQVIKRNASVSESLAKRVLGMNGSTASQDGWTWHTASLEDGIQVEGQTTSSTDSSDPHEHPSYEPPPTSAFSMCILADQYNLTALQDRAQNALINNLRPDTACSLLLATYKYKKLHAEIQKWMAANWSQIQHHVIQISDYNESMEMQSDG